MVAISGGPSVRIEGLNRLARTLKAAGGDLSDLRKLNAAVAGVVTPAAIAGTPVGPADRGHIRSTVRVGVTPRAVTLRAGTGAAGAYPYGGPLHWGWPARHIRSRPWLSEAAQSTEGAWLGVYERGLQAVLDKVSGA